MNIEAESAPPVLSMRGISKRFGSVVANDCIDLDLHRGRILGLLGENGAGKSTLMNILYGLYRPDAGEIRFDGQVVEVRDPHDAVDRGVGMVHQHFMLIPALTVAENIVLGAEPRTRSGLIDRTRAEQGVRELSARLGLEVDPTAYVGDLSVGMQQRVEILKALYRDARILVLDEPTAVLTPQEAEGLFEVLRSLARDGLAVCLITHKLDELLSVADQITVIRDGSVIGSVPAVEATEARLARMMVGREVVLRVDREEVELGPPLLQVEGLTVEENGRLRVRDANLVVHGGEIVGIAGVDGNGQVELAETIAGVRAADRGTIRLAERDITSSSVRERQAQGVAYVSEDRSHKGLVQEMRVFENAVLKRFRSPPFARHGFLSWAAMREFASELIRRNDVRPARTDLLASSLSGGNQQKLILARELSSDPTVLIAAQPTRGVDVAAIEVIHRQLLAQRSDGNAILLLSLDLDEVLTLSDRILVMYGGTIVGEFTSDEADEDAIGLLMAGVGVDTPDDPEVAA